MEFVPIPGRIRLVALLVCMTIAGIGPARRANAAPIVTLTLSINDDGSGGYAPGQFAVYASDSLDNGGIGGIGFSLAGNVTSYTEVAPFGIYPQNDGPFTVMGIVDGMPPTLDDLLMAQEGVPFPDGHSLGVPLIDIPVPVYGFGQSPGSLPPDPVNGTQLSYGAPLLMIQGTFDGTVSLVPGDYTNQSTFVFDDTTSVNTETPAVIFTTQTLPEPTGGMILLLVAGIAACRCRKNAIHLMECTAASNRPH